MGMGKEALKQIFNWLNSEMSLNLNNDDIFRSDAGKRHSSAWVVGLRCIFMVEMQIF